MRRHQRLVPGGERADTPTACTSFSIAWRAHSSGVWNSGPMSTSKPRSAKAVATTLAPRSWPSWPSLAIITRGRRPCSLGEGVDLALAACPSLRPVVGGCVHAGHLLRVGAVAARRPVSSASLISPTVARSAHRLDAQRRAGCPGRLRRASVSASSAACTAAPSRVGADLLAAARSAARAPRRCRCRRISIASSLVELVLVDADDHVACPSRCAPASRPRSPRSSAWPSRDSTALVMPPMRLDLLDDRPGRVGHVLRQLLHHVAAGPRVDHAA